MEVIFNREPIGQVKRKTKWSRVYYWQHGRTEYEVKSMIIHDGEKILVTLDYLYDIADVYYGIDFSDKLKLKRKHDFSEKAYMIRGENKSLIDDKKQVALVVHKDMLEGFEQEIVEKEVDVGTEYQYIVRFNGMELRYKYQTEYDLEKLKRYVNKQLDEIKDKVVHAESRDEIKEIVRNIHIYTV